jgi:regulation of enolase protein 1 (concanavalin A-like superfamily)
MTEITIPSISKHFLWKNEPLDWTLDRSDALHITAGANTDWFIDPKGDVVKSNAPVALFAPDQGDFILKARVSVDFASTFDAGVLMLYENDEVWAKLCFEFSPQRQPMVVTVVTKGISDDCNSVPIDGNQTYLRVAKLDHTFVFHYSANGEYWPMARYFTLGELSALQVGFSAQSPTGERCSAIFSDINYRQETLKNIRSGE